jgi:hypothetical protein
LIIGTGLLDSPQRQLAEGEMICAVCGQSYGLTHNCGGIAPQIESDEPPAKIGFPPEYYFTQGWKIVFWDDVAIRRTGRDSRSLPYGILFWIVGAALPVLYSLALVSANGLKLDPQKVTLVLAMVPVGFLVDFLRFGICHFLAKKVFDGSGTFMPLIRALLLGSVVSWLAVVPVVGRILAGIGSTIVIMVVFEELDHIERMQAFLLAVGVNIAFFELIYYLTSAFS